MNKKEIDLGSVGAIWNAFLGTSISFFPRSLVGQNGKTQRIDESIIMQEISTVLSKLDADDDADIQAYLQRGRESLDEVKALTEYQDQKATNLLTIIAFLTALAGALFTKFVDIYPFHATRVGYGSLWGLSLVAISYLLFAFFILCAISGALVIFHATRTLFKYPKPHALEQIGSGNRTRSYLFVKGIVDTTPTLWAASFIRSDEFVRDGVKEEATHIDPALQLSYFKNYVSESYLVACKVADKIRYLQPGQTILLISIRALLLWVVFMGATWVFVNPVQPASLPTQPNIAKPLIPTLNNEQQDNHPLAAPTTASKSDKNL